MKRMLDQKQIDQLAEFIESQGDAWVEQMKELIYVDDDILQIDNEVIFQQEARYVDDLIINSVTSIKVGEDEDTAFPFLTDQAGKVVVVNDDETGFEYKEPSSFMTQLTHSFNELEPTLKQIVDNAIADGGTNGVACTEAQWNVIKSLLDNSLYLNYDNSSLIKTCSNGIDNYFFGAGQVNGDCYFGVYKVEVSYDSDNSLLRMFMAEM